MNLTLAINTATQKITVALLDANNKNANSKSRLLAKKSWESKKRKSEKLLIEIDKLLGKKKPDQIIIVTGPGNFTSLRIGISVANALAYAYQIPIIGINTFELYKARLTEKNKVSIIMKAGNKFLYNLNKKVITLNEKELRIKLNKEKHKILFISPEIVDLNSNRTINHRTLKTTSDGFLELLEGKLNKKKTIYPTYFREPHITPSKKK